MKSRVALVVAIVLGAVATLGVYAVIQQTKAQVKEGLATDRVAIAARELSPGDVLTEDSIEWQDIPQRFISNDHILQKDADVYYQRKLSNRVTLDSPIMRNYFSISAEDITEKKPTSGYRAVSIQVDYAQGVSGLLRPNNRVDVYCTFKVKPIFIAEQDEEGKIRPPTEAEIMAYWKQVVPQLQGNKIPGSVQGQPKEEFTEELQEFFTLMALKGESTDVTFTTTIIQNALVLATDSQTEGGVAAYESVTLEVTPVQAQMLVFALDQGVIYLSLRNKFDTDPARLAPEYIEKTVDPRKISGPRSTSNSTGGSQ